MQLATPYRSGPHETPSGSDPDHGDLESAHRLLAARVEYWRCLLGSPRIRKAVLADLPRRYLDSEHGPALEEVKALSRSLRGRRGRNSEARRAEVLDALAVRLADLDPGAEAAERIASAIIDTHRGRSHADPLPREYVRGLAAVRRAFVEARNAMVAQHSSLVTAMARRYASSRRMPLEDLIQEGMLGLLRGVDRFDPRRGFRFSTYGTWWIRHAIGRALSDKGRLVRLPVHMVDLQRRVDRVRREALVEEGRAPQDDEVARILDLPLAKVQRLARAPLHEQGPARRDDGTYADPFEELGDEAPSAEDLLNADVTEAALEDGLAQLRPMEAGILRDRFGLDGNPPLTLQQIGDAHGLSRERIRQLQKRALERLREALAERGFEDAQRALAAS